MDALTEMRFCGGGSHCSFVSSVSVPDGEQLRS
jgi:hypothetical protein